MVSTVCSDLTIVQSHWFHVEREQCERAEREQAERERAKQEREDRERAEQAGAEREREKREREKQERAERKRAERKRAEQERAEQERAKLERAKQEQERQERAEQERARQERAAQERAERELLNNRLLPVKTSYHWDLRCMDGTRQSLLNQITASVTKHEVQKDEGNTIWIYGLPGIGKTSLAHSICASLHEGNNLAGAFFCRRDDPNLSEPRNILPTLICKLAIIFPPFRCIVAECLRNDPNLTPDSMKYSLFVDFICKLHHFPQRTLVFVIDAFDECGNPQSRPGVLKALIDAATHSSWLKVIIASRPEVDIHHAFAALTRPLHAQYDLAADGEATSDLRVFAQERFSKVASIRYLGSPWPDQLLFDGVISRAAGLFIFIETIARALEQCEDPTEHLKATLQHSAGTGLTALYGLYSSILKARILHSHDKFRQVIGVLLTTSPYRPLCEETIAKLAGVRADLVKMWMAALSALLYRDEVANGGIRIRHLSISDFFVSSECEADYRVNLQDANVQLGVTCLKTMIEQLCFNICKLEDSRLANADIQDLSSRIQENISDPLQYSCIYWSNHLCIIPNNGDSGVWESLKKFFKGPYALFWIEVLSLVGRVSIGVPSLRRVVSTWVRVSPIYQCSRMNLICLEQ